MKRLLHATVFSAVAAASGVLSASGVLGDMPGQPYLLGFLEQFAHLLAMSAVVVAIIAAFEARSWRGPRRVVLQASALALGVIAAALAIAVTARSHSMLAHMGLGTEGLFPSFLWFGFVASVLFSCYYAVRERAALAIDALAEESVMRHAALRRTDEARLNALRAQVDPALLDRKLAGIDDAYRKGSDAGDRKLDDLIDYLTGALRDSRGASKLDQGETDGFHSHAA
jgi:hypothetical protein